MRRLLVLVAVGVLSIASVGMVDATLTVHASPQQVTMLTRLMWLPCSHPRYICFVANGSAVCMPVNYYSCRWSIR